MSDDQLDDLRAALARLDPVPASVTHAARNALHRPEDAASVTDAVRFPFDRVVGMGYFPDELGPPGPPPGRAGDD